MVGGGGTPPKNPENQKILKFSKTFKIGISRPLGFPVAPRNEPKIIFWWIFKNCQIAKIAFFDPKMGPGRPPPRPPPNMVGGGGGPPQKSQKTKKFKNLKNWDFLAPRLSRGFPEWAKNNLLVNF
jgi:hypothetical protein